MYKYSASVTFRWSASTSIIIGKQEKGFFFGVLQPDSLLQFIRFVRKGANGGSGQSPRRGGRGGGRAAVGEAEAASRSTVDRDR